MKVAGTILDITSLDRNKMRYISTPYGTIIEHNHKGSTEWIGLLSFSCDWVRMKLKRESITCKLQAMLRPRDLSTINHRYEKFYLHFTTIVSDYRWSLVLNRLFMEYAEQNIFNDSEKIAFNQCWNDIGKLIGEGKPRQAVDSLLILSGMSHSSDLKYRCINGAINLINNSLNDIKPGLAELMMIRDEATKINAYYLEDPLVTK